MSEVRVFEAGDLVLQSGITLADAKLVYQVQGRPNAAGDNVILYCTRFGGSHEDNAFLIGPGMALDPERYCIVIPNLLGNGVSSSPSNTPPPQDRGGFPHVSIYDNVRLQQRLLSEELGIERIALAVGWSMGALQVYQWAALYPDMVARLAPIAGSARTSNHNIVFLEGMRAALTADPAWNEGWYETPPLRGLRALGRAWAGWALSQTFYRREMYKGMGYSSLEDFLQRYWEGLYQSRDANNILAMIRTWKHGDLSDNEVFRGDYAAALKAITATTFVMPGRTDLYFPPEDSEIEVEHLAGGELRVIPSVWGHYAGGGKDPADTRFIDEALKELLAR
jgi:homoserine O-acetyltransferase